MARKLLLIAASCVAIFAYGCLLGALTGSVSGALKAGGWVLGVAVCATIVACCVVELLKSEGRQ